MSFVRARCVGGLVRGREILVHPPALHHEHDAPHGRDVLERVAIGRDTRGILHPVSPRRAACSPNIRFRQPGISKETIQTRSEREPPAIAVAQRAM